VKIQDENGWTCETSGLDHPDRRDYEPGVETRFDGQPDGGQTDGLEGCYMEVVPGDITGGSVTWTGTGMFAAKSRKICFELSGDADTWCCMMQDAASSTNVQVQLEKCSVQTLI